MAEGRGGVVKKFPDHTTLSARTNEASRLCLNRAATPPPAEEGSSLTFMGNRPTLNSVALHAPVQRAPAEAERFRSPADIVFVTGKRFSDQ